MINRCIARTGSRAAFALLAVAPFAFASPALADASINAVYQQQTIRFTHLSSAYGAPAIGVADPGFTKLLKATGALLTWKPGERYVLITTSAPVVVSFALGDRRYDVGPITLQAAFAPFARGVEAYLPLDDVLRSLDLALRRDGAAFVLQPQLAGLDVRQDGSRTTLLAHGAAPLHPRVVRESDGVVTYAFDGVGTTLTGTRQINAGGVRSVQIETSGTVRDPRTLVTVTLAPGAVAEAPREEERDVALAFDGVAPAAPVVAEESPTPEPVPSAQASSGPTLVTGVAMQPSDDGVSVAIAIAGNASYEWHRLRDPDNRFWVDIDGAQLQGPPLDEGAPPPLTALRVRQSDPTTVRIALTLAGSKAVSVEPSATGLEIIVGAQDVADAPRSGGGSVGSVVSEGQPNPVLVTPAPLQPGVPGSSADSTWKFGTRSNYVPTNPRLIVLDPGHGGSDRGTIHGGVAEADLTLDMAKRLRDILIARGWEVKMTRDTDVDVYAPGDSARDELQARVDVANKAGARLFVSIHANAFINSGPYGTTCYVSKPEDVAFARIVEAQLAADGTKDDGIVKSHLYVTLHTRMPAVLVETAFLSNPSDYALLTSAAWRQKVAQEIADGIGQYTREYPVPNQPAQ
ncbi:MAG TPA: N-acetylmuramoyl-L-alanine amidase [Candidatus Binatia bacterium]|nr:N-acetylmuramoyl-L-alanine amidase [Candidatus Binatia bacterium]